MAESMGMNQYAGIGMMGAGALAGVMSMMPHGVAGNALSAVGVPSGVGIVAAVGLGAAGAALFVADKAF